MRKHLLLLCIVAVPSSCHMGYSASSRRYETSKGHFKFKSHSPIVFLHYLELKHREKEAGAAGSLVTIWVVPDSWIKEAHLSRLAALLDSNEPCVSVKAAQSSRHPFGESTMGREAAFLMDGFRQGRYPSALTSESVDVSNVKAWWDAYRAGEQLRKGASIE